MQYTEYNQLLSAGRLRASQAFPHIHVHTKQVQQQFIPHPSKTCAIAKSTNIHWQAQVQI